MGESNGYYYLGDNAELTREWDRYDRLPEPGDDPILDSFCERKGFTIEALVRTAGMLTPAGNLAFAYPGGIRYRDPVTGKNWNWTESRFNKLKIVTHGAEPSDTVIVCEGETDAAWLTHHYDVDVAVLPGVQHWKDKYATQLEDYALVLVGTDNDKYGDDCAAAIMAVAPHAKRFRPPANDWCDTETPPELPPVPVVLPVLVAAGELLDLEAPESASWFEQELLPIGGLMLLHGWVKSYKSFLTLDMLAALAQGRDWAGFEPTEEASRVCVIQFEIPWAYYQRRVRLLLAQSPEPDLFRQHFLTYTPLRRPQLVAGKRDQEDRMLKHLTEGDVQVVLIDPIRRASAGLDMNAEQDVGKMLGFFQRLNDNGITVVATHHDNKDSARHRGGDPLSMTGSGAFAGDPDSIVSIELPRGDDYRSSRRRNLCFTLRNAPAPSPRGFEMTEDEQLVYSPTAFGIDYEEDPDAPGI